MVSGCVYNFQKTQEHYTVILYALECCYISEEEFLGKRSLWSQTFQGLMNSVTCNNLICSSCNLRMYFYKSVGYSRLSEISFRQS